MILNIVAIVLSVLCIIYCSHLSIVYNTFNKNIKSWSINLDNSTREAINRSARDILRDLDKKITDLNEKKEDGND